MSSQCLEHLFVLGIPQRFVATEKALGVSVATSLCDLPLPSSDHSVYSKRSIAVRKH